MSDEGTAVRKRLAAALDVTDEGSLASVSALMCNEMTSLGKRLAAALDVTDKRSIAGVSTLM